MAKKPRTVKQRAHGYIVRCWQRASVSKRISLITAIIIGITGSIIGLSQAYPIVEPYWYVARYELRLVVDKQSIATDRQTLFQLQDNLDRARKDPAAARSPTVKQRIQELENLIRATQDRLEKATGSRQ